jgi:hypothetical protein
MINQPEHALVDFVALAAQLTNEQKILIAQQAALACLERIEVLLTPPASVLAPKEPPVVAAPILGKQGTIATAKRK